VKWEQVQKQGDEAIKRWINNALNGTSITVVLIGAETSTRRWVKYEISQSYNRGNGMLGIHIHNIKNSLQQTDTKGTNPFETLYITRNGSKVYLSQMYPTYDWVYDNGYENLGKWVEQAAIKAEK